MSLIIDFTQAVQDLEVKMEIQRHRSSKLFSHHLNSLSCTHLLQFYPIEFQNLPVFCTIPLTSKKGLKKNPTFRLRLQDGFQESCLGVRISPCLGSLSNTDGSSGYHTPGRPSGYDHIFSFAVLRVNHPMFHSFE